MGSDSSRRNCGSPVVQAAGNLGYHSVQLDPILPGMCPQPVSLRLQLFLLLVAGHPGVADREQRRRFVRQYHIPEATDPLDLQVCWKSALVEHPPGGLRVQTILAAPVGESDTFTYDHRE